MMFVMTGLNLQLLQLNLLNSECSLTIETLYHGENDIEPTVSILISFCTSEARKFENKYFCEWT